MANEYVGELNYAAACIESTWGTLPGSPSWVQIPYLGYGVTMNSVMRQSPTFVGVMQEKHNQYVQGMPAGSITMPLFGWWPANASKSHMGWMFDWLHNNSLETMAKPSRSWFLAEGPNIANKIHTGLRVNSFTLSGSAGSPVTLAVEVMGYDEIGMDDATARADTAPTLVTDRSKLTEVIFEDSTLTIGGSGTDFKAFSIKTSFNHTVGWEASTRPQLLLAKKVVTDVNLTIRKNSDTYDAYNRCATGDTFEVASTLNLKGLHRGTGTGGTNWTNLLLTFNRLSLLKPATEGGNDLQYQNLSFKALKPDSSSASYSYATSET